MTKVVPIKCPGCGNPMYSKDNDEVFLCKCGTLHARNGQVSIIEYEVGAFKPGDGEKVYLPFWKLGVDFAIKYQKVEGAMVSKFVGFLKGDSNAGRVDMLLPAFEASADRFKEMAKSLTLSPPRYMPDRFDPNVRREPCVIDVDMTDEMADFLFVTIEAEKPGVMQQLDYDMKVTSKKMLFLPYYRKGNSLVPGY